MDHGKFFSFCNNSKKVLFLWNHGNLSSWSMENVVYGSWQFLLYEYIHGNFLTQSMTIITKTPWQILICICHGNFVHFLCFLHTRQISHAKHGNFNYIP